jgi:hypothetical protein
LGALGSGGIYLLRLVPSLKQCREQHAGYPEIKNLHLSRWGTESVCRVIKRMLHPVSCHSCIRRWGRATVILQMQSVPVGIPKIHLSVRSLSSFLRETDFFVSALNPALFLLRSLQKHGSDIVYLQKTKPCIRKHLITKADRSLVDCLCVFCFISITM